MSQDIKCTRRRLNASFDHLPTITLDIGLGKATKTTVHFYYREWKNGVTGESDTSSQLHHIRQHISQWREIVHSGRNFIALGDANMCALSWNEQNFRYKELADEVQNFLLLPVSEQVDPNPNSRRKDSEILLGPYYHKHSRKMQRSRGF